MKKEKDGGRKTGGGRIKGQGEGKTTPKSNVIFFPRVLYKFLFI